MKKLRKKMIVAILTMTMLMGASLVVSANNVTGTATVNKKSLATVHSLGSGGTFGYATYGASCTKKSMLVIAEQYRNGKYQFGHSFNISKNLSASSKTSNTGSKIWRVKLSGTGYGSAWITAQ